MALPEFSNRLQPQGAGTSSVMASTTPQFVNSAAELSKALTQFSGKATEVYAADVEAKAGMAGMQAGADQTFQEQDYSTIAGAAYNKAGIAAYQSSLEVQLRKDVAGIYQKNRSDPAKLTAEVERVVEATAKNLPASMQPAYRKQAADYSFTYVEKATEEAHKQQLDAAEGQWLQENEVYVADATNAAYDGNVAELIGVVDANGNLVREGQLAQYRKFLERHGPDGTMALTHKEIEEEFKKARDQVFMSYGVGWHARQPNSIAAIGAIERGDTGDPVLDAVLKDMSQEDRTKLRNAMVAGAGDRFTAMRAEWAMEDRHRADVDRAFLLTDPNTLITREYIDRAEEAGASPQVIEKLNERRKDQIEGTAQVPTDEEAAVYRQWEVDAIRGTVTQEEADEAYTSGAINEPTYRKVNEYIASMPDAPFVNTTEFKSFTKSLQAMVAPVGYVDAKNATVKAQVELLENEAWLFLYERASAQFELKGEDGLSLTWYRNQIEEYANAVKFLRTDPLRDKEGPTIRYATVDAALAAYEYDKGKWRDIEDEIEIIMQYPGARDPAGITTTTEAPPADAPYYVQDAWKMLNQQKQQ